ncbi:MAG TPA: hypothetical protein VF868_10615 [Bacteroidia bacterium]|jgi:hypothetical protein
MKTKITTFGLLLFMAVSATVFNGCKGKDGAPGAEGPKGADGNANVVGTTSATISSWTLGGGILYSASLTSTAITQAIVDKGVIMVYEDDGSGGWYALPYTLAIESSSFGFGYASGGFVNIYITNTDGSTPSHPGTRTYRIVAITSRGMEAHPEVDVKNYAQVKQAFNLKD